MSLTYKHHVIDTGLQGGGYAQTALADLDGCGRPEFIVGRRETGIPVELVFQLQGIDPELGHKRGLQAGAQRRIEGFNDQL